MAKEKSCCSTENGKAETLEKSGMSCCGPEKTPLIAESACCKPQKDVVSSCCETSNSWDYLLWFSLTIVVSGYLLYILNVGRALPALYHFTMAIYELMNSMFVGLMIGVVMVTLLAKVPREFVIAILGSGKGVAGLCRATLAGLLLDLCSHGILMVGAKLYERGVSIGQVMAFLIASPWNSLSLTVILISLIGLGWTLAFIVLSAVIALITGYVFNALVASKRLPSNPNEIDLPSDFVFWPAAKREFSAIPWKHIRLTQLLKDGFKESRMVIRWLLFGVVLASLIRTFVSEGYFETYFGPTLLGLGLTIVAATIIEVCSEGSTPIAADIFNRAHAPGNSFSFLMAGVSTDYTEIMIIKETTRSWKLALFLPLLSLPQIIIIGWALNNIAS